LVLHPCKPFSIEPLYSDSKSHTGIFVLVGGVVVFAASRKQNVLQKNTESELVALLDNIGFVELSKSL
jgi:hypothetical protein